MNPQTLQCEHDYCSVVSCTDHVTYHSILIIVYGQHKGSGHLQYSQPLLECDFIGSAVKQCWWKAHCCWCTCATDCKLGGWNCCLCIM